MNESSIYFFPGGGHNHDGVNSSLIDTSAYSIFDFDFGNIGGPNRVYRQELNQNGFKQFIISTVNSSILEPSGLVLQPGIVNGNAHIIAGSVTGNEIAANTITANEIAANTITANEILAGTITGDLLNANVVLVNQIIASDNYVPGVSGWAISGDGTAEFANTSIRGAIQADAVVIDSNNYWISSEFSVTDNAGNGLYVDSNVAIVSGTIIAQNGSIGNWILSNGTLVDDINNPSMILSNSNSGEIYVGTDILISGASGGSIQAGNLLIVNNDIFAEDITASTLLRVGSNNVNDAMDLNSRGIYYTKIANNFGHSNYSISFSYNGTNLIAHLWDGASYTDVCLTNCGSGSSPADPDPVVVGGVDPVVVGGVDPVVVGGVDPVVVGTPPPDCVDCPTSNEPCCAPCNCIEVKGGVGCLCP